MATSAACVRKGNLEMSIDHNETCIKIGQREYTGWKATILIVLILAVIGLAPVAMVLGIVAPKITHECTEEEKEAAVIERLALEIGAEYNFIPDYIPPKPTAKPLEHIERLK